jgi:pimeloyl-ACP methyl ester carboxylesterase
MPNRNPATPVLFIHGMWLHATSWRPWIGCFEECGYKPLAPGWPGEPDDVEGARRAPGLVANRGIEDLTAHFRQIAAKLPSPPILIGHSFGGLIAQKLLGEGVGRAAIAINPAQMKGVLPLPLPSSGPAFRRSATRSTSRARSP